MGRWCSDNSLSLNTSKTKELIINFKKGSGGYAALHQWRHGGKGLKL